MSASLGQPLKWHGGKNYLAREIVARMSRHLNYVEPYFGGGAVLFARDPADESLWLPPHKGVSEIVNDLNGELTNFWHVMRNDHLFDRLRRFVEATPFSGADFEKSKAWLERYGGCDSLFVERAYNFFVANRQSLAGRMRGFTGITKTRVRAGMNNEVSAWLSAVEGLPAVHDRLKRVLVLKPQPAVKVIHDFDRPETLFYLDPPYLHETRATTTEYGPHEMSWADHAELLDRLLLLKANFMLSGYRSELYDQHAGDGGWRREEFPVPNHASGARKKETKVECLWCNF